MPFTCPRCGARIEAGAIEGALRCAHCATVLYAEGNVGIPHRIVALRASEADIRRAGAEWLRRSGRGPESGPLSLFYVPYFVLRAAGGAGEWEGRAAVSLSSPVVSRIAVLGSDTTWFDPAAATGGATILAPTLGSAEVAGDGAIEELRHVPIAHLACEDGREPPALWIDADRCRVLDPLPAQRGRSADSSGLHRWLAAEAACIGALALVVPAPWSILGAAALFLAFHRGVRNRFSLPARRGAPGAETP